MLLSSGSSMSKGPIFDHKWIEGHSQRGGGTPTRHLFVYVSMYLPHGDFIPTPLMHIRMTEIISF